MSTVAPSQTGSLPPGSLQEPKEKKTMWLWAVFVLGFLFSVLVVGSLMWAFAAHQAGNWFFWEAGPPLNSDALFGIIRNAVTVAAALGVGITLFFSYRKQRTAELTHRISAEAQRTAARALELTAKQHGSDLTRGMRERFSKAAEHLGSANASLAIAGAHALEALAGEWYDAGNFRERQNCIDLLCSYPMISEQHSEQKGFPVASVKSAVVTRVFAHLARNLQPRDYWAVRIDMKNPGFMTDISNLYVNGAYLDFRNLTPGEETGYFEHLTLERGTIDLRAMDLDREALYFYDCNFAGGEVSLGLEAEYNASGAIRFRKCEFDGTNFWVPYDRTEEFAVIFEDCTFREGAFFDEKTHPRTLNFVNCTFEKQVFPTDPGTWIDKVELVVDSKTSFAEGVPVLNSGAGARK